MNQAFQNTILASAVAAAILLFVLIAARTGTYEQPGPYSAHYSVAAPPGQRVTADLGRNFAVGFGSLARPMQGDMAAADTAAGALSLASALVATSVVEATLASMLEDPGNRRRPSANDAPIATPRTRNALAMPYFGTARSLRPDNTGVAP
ncbi:MULTISPECIES: hypothetical protein [unclassified Luteimonas]